MSPTALRWGRSAYETPADLALEAELLGALGVELRREEGPAPALEGVELLITTSGVRVTRELLGRAPALRGVLTTTSGYDHIDLGAARERGVWVARCPLARRDAVVDSAVGMALALLRGLPTLHETARQGRWARAELPSLALGRAVDQRVGVVGAGVIGRRVVEVWQALGAEVWVCDPASPDGRPLGALLRSCTVLTLHCALTPATRGLIGPEALAALLPGAVLINTARGACVDAAALLEVDHLGGVGLDVFPEEPWPQLAALAARPRTLLTPHAAGYHTRLGEAVAREVADTVGAWLGGQALEHRVA